MIAYTAVLTMGWETFSRVFGGPEHRNCGKMGVFSPWHKRCLAGNSIMALIDGIFSQPNYLATKKMLDATALRHEAIASNLANVETPGYKRLEVAGSFKEELNRALSSGNSQSLAQLRPSLVIDPAAISSGPDGNTVQLESELLQLNQNTLAHSVETQLVTSNLLKLRQAITGRTS